MNIVTYFSKQFQKMFDFIPQYFHFLKEFLLFKSLDNRSRFSYSFFNQYPCLSDKTTQTPFEPHYLYHPAWAARIVKKINPKKHIDISSTLTFCTILSAFVPVEFYDYRPAEVKLSNLKSKEGDLLALPFKDNSVESLSCMHTIEHIGLGRYGDPVDPEGDLKAINELKRVVKKGGSLIFVTPVGKPIIRFNAHRIYSYKQIMEYFSDFKLKEFSLVPDDYSQGIVKDATSTLANKQNWGCGCFWFIKE